MRGEVGRGGEEGVRGDANIPKVEKKDTSTGTFEGLVVSLPSCP